MYLVIISGSICLLALIYIIFIFFSKLPLMRMVAPETSSAVRDKKKKNEIIKSRVERVGSDYVSKVKKNIFLPIGKVIQNSFRRLAGKLIIVERRFQERQKRVAHITNPEVLAESLLEAQAFIDADELDRAEKKLIEVIGIDNKFTDAYEMLGKVYLERRDLELAEETFRFLVKMAKGDASAITYLGEVLEEQGKKSDALIEYEKAVELSPKNPKYLDLMILIALDLKDEEKAKNGIDKLKEVNAENKKIEIFEERLKNLKK